MANYEIVVDKAKGEITLTMKTNVPLGPEDSMNIMGLFWSRRTELYQEHLEGLKVAPPPKHVKEQTEDGVNRYVTEQWLNWYAEMHPGNSSRKRAIAEAIEAAVVDEFGSKVLPKDYRISCPDPDRLCPEIILERIYTERR